tara:strand:+ start:2319 stop:2519 length:201 start_codon:yes stop_codon:yes gene_type:complete
MAISKEKLIEERDNLQAQFDTVRQEIVKAEKQVEQMKGNLNALNGAIQQTNKLIGMFEEVKEDEKV